MVIQELIVYKCEYEYTCKFLHPFHWWSAVVHFPLYSNGQSALVALLSSPGFLQTACACQTAYNNKMYTEHIMHVWH